MPPKKGKSWIVAMHSRWQTLGNLLFPFSFLFCNWLGYPNFLKYAATSPNNLNPLTVVWAFLEERVKTNANCLHPSPPLSSPLLLCSWRSGAEKEGKEGWHVLHSPSHPGSLPTTGVPHVQGTLPSSSPGPGQMLKAAAKQTKEQISSLSKQGYCPPIMFLQRWNTTPAQPPFLRDLLPRMALARCNSRQNLAQDLFLSLFFFKNIIC